MKQVFQELKIVKQNHGIESAAYEFGMRLINKLTYFHSLHCIVISKVKESSLLMDAKYRHGFLDEEQLLMYAKNKENELSESFVREALAKGDRCYGITHDGELAAYGWYSHCSTPTDVQNLSFCFNPSYVYMYKGFTKKSYRGQRLHAVGMSWALKHYLQEGDLGIVSYVDSVNFDSLKSCYRMGYQFIGALYVLKVFGKVLSWSSSACHERGLAMRPDIPKLGSRGDLEVSSQF